LQGYRTRFYRAPGRYAQKHAHSLGGLAFPPPAEDLLTEAFRLLES
jgi:hypothetical protein